MLDEVVSVASRQMLLVNIFQGLDTLSKPLVSRISTGLWRPGTLFSNPLLPSNDDACGTQLERTLHGLSGHLYICKLLSMTEAAALP